MLTKEQKKEIVASGVKELAQNKSLVLVDFDGLPTADLRRLRVVLRSVQAKLNVIKKRLLRIVFDRGKVNLDPTQFAAQVGTIFVPGALYDGVAGKIHGLIKELMREKKELKILAAYDLAEHRPIGVEEFNAIAKLPSREILLTQIAAMLTMPIKKVMYALNSRREQLEKSSS